MEENWYDLVDQDCDGNDQDQDGDGYDLADDCDDTDAAVNPAATETWADGVDQDCDGIDDDLDGDGFGAAEDCDDTDPTINPYAQEIWYDDIDQNCDGNDDDQDHDGVPVNEDCDDTNASMTPGATEVWYDGIDQDCDGNDDDQDLDGYREALDCDDTDAAVNPGAEEVWYDGVDGDCDMADDYDADHDGWMAEDWGEDCDDTDPTVSPDGTETLGDAVDGDCDGNVDQPAFVTLGSTGTGLSGPRIAESADGAVLGVLAVDLGSGDPGSLQTFLDPDEPWDGAIATDGWSFSGGATLGVGYDLAADDDAVVEGIYLSDSGSGYALAVATDSSGVETFGVSATGLGDFEDIHVALSGEDYELVFCEDSDDFIIYMRGDAAELLDNDALWAYSADQGGQACALNPGSNQIWLSDADSGKTRSYSYDGDTSLNGTGTASGTFIDRDVDVENSIVAMVTVTSSALELKRNGVSETWAVNAELARVHADGSDLYVGYIDTGGDAWLIYGDMTNGFIEVALDTGLSDADDIDVFVTSGDGLVVGVRDGDTVVWMAVSL
jgi:hypothetical protein